MKYVLNILEKLLSVFAHTHNHTHKNNDVSGYIPNFPKKPDIIQFRGMFVSK